MQVVEFHAICDPVKQPGAQQLPHKPMTHRTQVPLSVLLNGLYQQSILTVPTVAVHCEGYPPVLGDFPNHQNFVMVFTNTCSWFQPCNKIVVFYDLSP